jgi:hypothetical protein
MTRKQFIDVLVDSIRGNGVPEAKEVCQTTGIQLAGNIRISKERLYLRSEGELGAAPEVVERFFTDAITREKQPLPRSIPDGNRKHAIESAEAIDIPLFVGMQNYFGITACSKDMTAVFKLRAQIQKIVQLAIKDQATGMIFIPDRLVTAGHVDNA